MDPQANQLPNPNQLPTLGEQLIDPSIMPSTPQLPMPIGGQVASAPMQAPVMQQTVGATPINQAPSAVPMSQDLLANDVDVIEKEWVDVAEQVVRDTADDPHAEEEAVENLQVDYMKKRYGKDIKKG